MEECTVPTDVPMTDRPASPGDGNPGEPVSPKAGRRERSPVYLAAAVCMLLLAAITTAAMLSRTTSSDESAAPPATAPRVPPTPPPSGDLGFGFGVYRGSGAADEVAAYERWIGRPVTHVVDFVGGAGEESKNPWKSIDDPSWWCNRWRDTGRKVVYSVAILPDDRLTLEAGAQGSYNDHWRRFGEVMVQRGCGDPILRLGWEFNGRYYPWAAGGKETAFAEYWRQIVNTLRSVEGTAFTFEWSPIAGNYNADVDAAYPGDPFVDIVGLSSYDTSPLDSPDVDQRWHYRLNEPIGLLWHRNFSTRHGKPMSYPEWGLTVRPGDDLGGDDNPRYIESMYEWFSENNVEYASYFETDADDAAHRLDSDQFPQSRDVFLSLFGKPRDK